MSFLSSLRERSARRRGLDDMLKLDDHLLRDMGVTRAEIMALRRGKTPSRNDV